jgi:hypothetical protein
MAGKGWRSKEGRGKGRHGESGEGAVNESAMRGLTRFEISFQSRLSQAVQYKPQVLPVPRIRFCEPGLKYCSAAQQPYAGHSGLV